MWTIWLWYLSPINPQWYTGFHISHTDVTKVFSCTISCLGIWMYFNNNYFNVILVLQCTENIFFNTVPVITESLQKSADMTNLKVHVPYIWQLTFKYRIWSKGATPPLPSPYTMSHMQLFASIVIRAWSHEVKYNKEIPLSLTKLDQYPHDCSTKEEVFGV